MTVQELMDELAKYPPHLNVMISVDKVVDECLSIQQEYDNEIIIEGY
jgi:hypothetical protein